jgi:hypothetical protein
MIGDSAGRAPARPGRPLVVRAGKMIGSCQARNDRALPLIGDDQVCGDQVFGAGIM